MAKATENTEDGKARVGAGEADGTATKTKIIKVRSTIPQAKDGGHPIALYEVNSAHPGQVDPKAKDPNNPDARIGRYEAYVAGPAVVEVAETPEVAKAIRDGKIEVV